MRPMRLYPRANEANKELVVLLHATLPTPQPTTRRRVVERAPSVSSFSPKIEDDNPTIRSTKDSTGIIRLI